MQSERQGLVSSNQKLLSLSMIAFRDIYLHINLSKAFSRSLHSGLQLIHLSMYACFCVQRCPTASAGGDQGACCHAIFSSSLCERNWSAFDFVHSKRRNKLSSARANDLVNVFSNKQLLRWQARMSKKGQHASFVPWHWFDNASEESEQDE
jgi:hypothetical protein